MWLLECVIFEPQITQIIYRKSVPTAQSTLRSHYKDRPINTVQGESHCSFRKHTYYSNTHYKENTVLFNFAAVCACTRVLEQ
jgi:hypothetical protein